MKILGTIGDVNPVDHGGGVIIDAGYGPQLVWYQDTGRDDGTVNVFRVFIADNIEADLDWVDWDALDSYTSVHPDEIDGRFSASATPAQRAQIYADAGSYHGWANLDNYPVTMTLAEAEIHHDNLGGEQAAAS
jgi:hypothetical protein